MTSSAGGFQSCSETLGSTGQRPLLGSSHQLSKGGKTIKLLILLKFIISFNSTPFKSFVECITAMFWDMMCAVIHLQIILTARSGKLGGTHLHICFILFYCYCGAEYQYLLCFSGKTSSNSLILHPPLEKYWNRVTERLCWHFIITYTAPYVVSVVVHCNYFRSTRKIIFVSPYVVVCPHWISDWTAWQC